MPSIHSRVTLPGFDDVARSREYASVLGPAAKGWYRQCAALVRSRASGARRIVDLGCGPGNLLAALSPMVPDVGLVGLDRSQPMLDLARSLLRDSALLVRGSFDSIPFDDETFDLAVATAVFHHTGNLTATLREARRILAPGGRLVCVAFRRDAPRWAYGLARAHAASKRLSGSRLEGFHDVLRGSWTRAEIAGALRGAGFAYAEIDSGPIVLKAVASR